MKQVKQLVAMGCYYRRYVKDFASMVRHIVNLTEACDRAFESMKKTLVSTDVMGYAVNKVGDFILDVDAVLHLIQEGLERVIAYASRALNKAEKKYCVTEQQLLAVRYFIEQFRQKILGKKRPSGSCLALNRENPKVVKNTESVQLLYRI